MTDAHQTAKDPAAMGELALAIVFEDLKARVSKKELSEEDARTLIEAALHHFPADMHPELHALVDR
jgi:hypothetical protein